MDLHISMKLPIPTFLIPLALCRWVIVKLVRLVYPYLLYLNETFAHTTFAQRVADDADGFYRRVADSLNDEARAAARCEACQIPPGPAEAVASFGVVV